MLADSLFVYHILFLRVWCFEQVYQIATNMSELNAVPGPGSMGAFAHSCNVDARLGGWVEPDYA